jgi:pyruvate dehydrogenase E2 component (dihydrolipoamide acetyltransferase)
MAIEILMPALSPTMTEGNLAKWLKKEGDKVKPGDVLAEIETDKATMEVEAVDAGTLGKIVVQAKTEGVKVNQLIAVLLEANEAKSAVDEVLKKHQGGVAVATQVKQEVAQKVEQPKVVNAPASVTQSSSIYKRLGPAWTNC